MVSEQQTKELEAVMRREEKILVRWLTNKLGDADTARDVLQTVFLRVISFGTTRRIENPRALLFKTASNLALNELKRQNRFNSRHVSPTDTEETDPLLNVASPAPSPEAETAFKEDVSLTLQAIDELPERSRQAFTMNRFDGLSYKDIAEAMNVSESSVEKYMIDALKRLREKLKTEIDRKGKVVTFPGNGNNPSTLNISTMSNYKL